MKHRISVEDSYQKQRIMVDVSGLSLEERKVVLSLLLDDRIKLSPVRKPKRVAKKK